MEKIEIGAECELMDLVESHGFTDKEIFFMGNIRNIFSLLKILAMYGLSMMGIVDNDVTKAGVHVFRDTTYRIYTAEEFFSHKKEKVALFVFSERFWCEMREQMIRKGYVDGLNLFVLNGVTYEKKCRYIKKADQLIRMYQEKYGRDVFLLLFYGPVGDNYLFALFLKRYFQKRAIENYLIVGTRATKKICDLFGFSKFERAEREEIVALEYLYMFLGKDAGMIKVMQMWDWTFHLNRDRIRFCEEFTFMDTFRSYIFHFDDKETPEFPCFNNNQDMIRKEFEVKGLEKGNTVILAPFAYSLEHPPKEFWRCLTGYLSEMGKKVVVNIDPASIHGKEENYISGIPEISFDLREGVPCLEYAGIFIGMRSGLCDIISSAKCKKIILYPQVSGIDYDRHRPDKAFSSLEAMGLCDEVTELELDMEGNTEYWNEQARQIVLKIKQEKK